MKLSFTTLDVFTSTRYLGNPLAIIQVPSSLKSSLTQTQKLAIAKEFNLSETVFMHEAAAGASEVTVDIFTHQAEIPFAGHPTIGSAFYVLSLQGQKHVNTLVTKAGKIPLSLSESGSSAFITAQVPQDVHIHALTLPSPLAAEGQKNPVVSIVNGMTFCYIQLADLEALGKATTNVYGADEMYSNLDRLDEGWRNGLVGTMYFVSQGKDEDGVQKYRTRMWGSREDPATGSASSGLGAWLALQDKAGSGTYSYKLTQGVEMGSKSEIEVVVVRGEEGIKTVALKGTAVQVMEGTLEV